MNKDVMVTAFTEHTHRGVQYYPGHLMPMTIEEKDAYTARAIALRGEPPAEEKPIVDVVTSKKVR